MTQINNNVPTLNTSAMSESFAEIENESRAASLAQFGGAEALIADLSNKLEKFSDRSKKLEGALRESAHKKTLSAVAEKKEAARDAMWAGIATATVEGIAGLVTIGTAIGGAVGDAGKAASDASTTAQETGQSAEEVSKMAGNAAKEAQAAGTAAKIIKGGMDAVSAGAKMWGSVKKADADIAQANAEIMQEQAKQIAQTGQDEKDWSDKLERSADKLRDKMEQISQARQQAKMAAVQG